jgi:formate dehydrogenase major subunit
VDEAFIRERTNNFEALKANVHGLQPRGHGADLRHPGRDAARGGARVRHAKASMILWGMGVSQHVHGTDNARCLIALAPSPARSAARHRPAPAARPEQRAGRQRRGADPHDVPQLPARGQRRGACVVRRLLGHEAGRPPGYTVVEIMHKALAPDSDPHKVRGMYIMGENPP